MVYASYIKMQTEASTLRKDAQGVTKYSPRHFPYVAFLSAPKNDEKQAVSISCTGFIAGIQHVISARQCTYDLNLNDLPNRPIAVVGNFKYVTDVDYKSANVQKQFWNKIFTFSPIKHDIHDIMIVYLENPLIFNNRVNKVAVVSIERFGENEEVATVVGFGKQVPSDYGGNGFYAQYILENYRNCKQSISFIHESIVCSKKNLLNSRFASKDRYRKRGSQFNSPIELMNRLRDRIRASIRPVSVNSPCVGSAGAPAVVDDHVLAMVSGVNMSDYASCGDEINFIRFVYIGYYSAWISSIVPDVHLLSCASYEMSNFLGPILTITVNLI